jgi:hypothetical protein
VVDEYGLVLRTPLGERFIDVKQVSYLRTFVEGSGKHKTEGVVVRLIGGEEIRLPMHERDELIAAVREIQRAHEDAKERRDKGKRARVAPAAGYRDAPRDSADDEADEQLRARR